MRYAKVVLGLPMDEVFDYFVPERLSKDCPVGCRVGVSFGMRNLIGYVVGISSKTKIKKVKSITKLIDMQPVLDKNFLKLTRLVSDYYCSSWGQAIEAALPVGLRRGLPVNILARNDDSNDTSHKDTFLQGGSFEERFKIYGEHIDRTLEQRKSVIILSPEVRLCLSIFELLKKRYPGKVEFTYRKQNAKEELRIWGEARNGSLDILVGTRAAVFAPFTNLGLLIVENEDAYGYKDERAPYYHCRDVAAMRAELEKIPLILSSNTPSLESYYAVKRKKYALINIADKNAEQQVKITIADMRQYGRKLKGRMLFSPVLEDKMRKAIQSGKKIIIFINRKGYASFVYCQKCGYTAACDKCSSKLIFHFEEKKLVCNSCGLKKALFELCPKCNANYIRFKGYGIEKVISQLHLVFPQARISRIDKEHAVFSPDFQILAATEMVFHQDSQAGIACLPAGRLPRCAPRNDSSDFAGNDGNLDSALKAEIVGALNLDSALNIINFRSSEKLYALVERLKSLATEELIIQTAIPEFFAAKEFINLELDKLYDAELKERKALSLPPFTHLITLKLRAKNLARVQASSMNVYEKLRNMDKKVEVFEPIEAIPLRRRGYFCFNILLKAKNPLAVNRLLKKRLKEIRLQGARLAVEVDPQ